MGRIVVALVIAPILGGLAYILAASVTFGSVVFAHAPGIGVTGGPNSEDLLSTFVASVVVATVFEVLLLLPAAYLLRHQPRFLWSVIAVGIGCWIVLIASGLILIGQNALSVAITTAQLLALGVPVVLAFATIAQRGLRA